ncbi:phage portal protein [Paenibacillus whitsoniae]|uniref:Phage portal protein n=2 Tax=Paenibacillus whitsoniae TaxID=2496558 RepID=A0A430J7V3_9BACL|nr:phage portal protein [Paenibacillus whitsoniae]
MSFGRNLYDTPEIRTAINFVAEKIGSIPFYHARADNEGNVLPLKSRLQYVLEVRTNPLHTPQVFWTFVITRLLLANNVYMFPDWDDSGNLRAIYPLPYAQHEFLQDDAGKIVIKFPAGGEQGLFYYDDILHLQRFPTQTGGAQRQATGGYTEIVNTLQEQSVKDSKNSQRIAALLINKSQLKGTDQKKKLEEFKELFLTAENTTGFGMIGAEYDVHNLDLKMQPLNKEVLETVVGYLYTYFGGSREVFTHTASEIQYEQFIDNTIRPLAYQIEEELTYKLFSMTEIAHDNKVLAELIDLEISTLSSKTTFFKEMLFGSVMTRNEIRRRLRIPKGPPELDKFMESKNFQTLKPGSYTVEGGEENNGD